MIRYQIQVSKLTPICSSKSLWHIDTINSYYLLSDHFKLLLLAGFINLKNPMPLHLAPLGNLLTLDTNGGVHEKNWRHLDKLTIESQGCVLQYKCWGNIKTSCLVGVVSACVDENRTSRLTSGKFRCVRHKLKRNLYV